MIIHIVTIHYAHNYGAVLQAFSLKKVLENMGHEVYFVNYIPEAEQKKYDKKLRNEIGIRESIKKFRIWRWIKGAIEAKAAQKEWINRYNNFREFIDKYLICGYLNGKQLQLNEIQKLVSDAFICGSDQIWNEKITGICNSIYYLGFNDKAIKIAYAASMGTVYVPEGDTKEKIQNWLNKYKSISVREAQLKNMLEEELNIENVNVVADPCLLLNKEDFVEIIDNKIMEDKPYALTYFISETGLLKNIFKNIQSIDGKDIIEIHWKKQIFQKNKKQKNSLKVEEFLSYILNADVVYTDSFHGVVFSLLFHIPFYAIYNENTRIDDLLENVGLKKRHITSLNEKKNTGGIDWEMVDENIEKLRCKSKKFIADSLG